MEEGKEGRVWAQVVHRRVGQGGKKRSSVEGDGEKVQEEDKGRDEGNGEGWIRWSES